MTTPMQPIVVASDGVIRFKRNEIVQLFINAAAKGQKMTLNDISVDTFSTEDVEQFWQLMGYSVSGYGDLSFIRPETVAIADEIADRLRHK